jgi:hypothetical protein
MLFAEDVDGDQGCGSESFFKNVNARDFIGKRIINIALEGTVTSGKLDFDVIKLNKSSHSMMTAPLS